MNAMRVKCSVLLIVFSLLAMRPSIADQYQGDQDMQARDDEVDTDRQLDRSDNSQWKSDHEQESLESQQAQLSKSYDDLQRAEYELTHDIDELSAKQRDVENAMHSVLQQLNDVHQRLGQF